MSRIAGYASRAALADPGPATAHAAAGLRKMDPLVALQCTIVRAPQRSMESIADSLTYCCFDVAAICFAANLIIL